MRRRRRGRAAGVGFLSPDCPARAAGRVRGRRPATGVADGPAGRVLDSSGHEIEYCDDTPGLGEDVRFAHTFDRDGDVVVEVRDANYEGSSDFRYRLRVGDFPAVTTAFPVGARGGAEASFEFVGLDGLRVGPLTYRLPDDGQQYSCGVKYPGGRSSAFVPVFCGGRGEFIAKTPNHTPETAGAADAAGVGQRAVRCFGRARLLRDRCDEGRADRARGQTRRWGSPSDLYFTVYKADGSKIAETKIAEYKPAMKGVLPPLPDEGQVEFTAPADGVYRLAVEDLNRAGGPGMVYRLDVERAGKDFALSVDVDKIELTPGGTAKLKVKAERQGYGGPITLALRARRPA